MHTGQWRRESLGHSIDFALQCRISIADFARRPGDFSREAVTRGEDAGRERCDLLDFRRACRISFVGLVIFTIATLLRRLQNRSKAQYWSAHSRHIRMPQKNIKETLSMKIKHRRTSSPWSVVKGAMALPCFRSCSLLVANIACAGSSFDRSGLLHARTTRLAIEGHDLFDSAFAQYGARAERSVG